MFLFVTKYTCLCFISIFAWILFKKAAFAGITSRIIGYFKKNC